jgi:aspartate carbamoyltransferase catalytic subunit
MVRGMEITAEVADSGRCTVTEQVANGVSIRMAVLYLLLGGSDHANNANNANNANAAGTTARTEEK